MTDGRPAGESVQQRGVPGRTGIYAARGLRRQDVLRPAYEAARLRALTEPAFADPPLAVLKSGVPTNRTSGARVTTKRV
jgi:hypothetical protein